MELELKQREEGGIRWPFARGAITRGGCPKVAIRIMGRAQSQTAHRTRILASKVFIG
jgi:hypothetical protein